jgi:hypothetical protein
MVKQTSSVALICTSVEQTKLLKVPFFDRLFLEIKSTKIMKLVITKSHEYQPIFRFIDVLLFATVALHNDICALHITRNEQWWICVAFALWNLL